MTFSASLHYTSCTFWVDLKSVLYALKHLNIIKPTFETVAKISHIIHFLILQGTINDSVRYHRTVKSLCW